MTSPEQPRQQLVLVLRCSQGLDGVVDGGVRTAGGEEPCLGRVTGAGSVFVFVVERELEGGCLFVLFVFVFVVFVVVLCFFVLVLFVVVVLVFFVFVCWVLCFF